jgi:serine/threonine-protein kinase
MGEDDLSGLFLVFELIQGPTLREKLHSGPLAPAEVAQVARALGSALTHAHGKGLVHRDVKPENVMLGPTGPKLTDFGWFAADAVARSISHLATAAAGADRGSEARATRSSGSPFVSSTPAYSAPEVLASGAFSAYGDQFSLAATLFEALTGRRAFPGGDSASVAARVATAKHPAVTSLVPALRAFPHVDPILDRALAKEAKNRFGSCEAFTTVLANELEGSNATFLSTPLPRSSIVPRATRRWQNSAALAAFAVIVLLVVAGRYHRSSEAMGVSLKSVASSFAGTVAGAGRGSPAAPHHSRAGASASSSSATSSAAAAANTTSPGNMTVITPTEASNVPVSGSAFAAPAPEISAAIPLSHPSESSGARLDSGPR